MHAMRTGVHTALGSSPGSLVFHRDMFLNIPLIADWHAITQKREHLVNENLIRENNKRRSTSAAILAALNTAAIFLSGQTSCPEGELIHARVVP